MGSTINGVKFSAVGISAISQSGISIYPNPIAGLLQIGGVNGDYQIEVFNDVNEAIFTTQLSGND